MAKLVMRRDLALCREQIRSQDPPQADELSTNNTGPNLRSDTDQQTGKVEAENAAPAADIVMQDSQPTDIPETASAASEDAALDRKTDDVAKSADETKNQSSVLQAPAETSETSQKPNEAGLQVNTQSQTKADNPEDEAEADEEKQPDTGTFSNTNDLESLFGGPLSAGAGDASGFNVDADANDNDGEFNFDDFGENLDSNAADNDDISALLPSLQDYANNAPAENDAPDFDDLFATDMPNNAEGEEADMEHRDSTFDDLFDLTDFNPGDFSAGAGEGASNENQDFDFSFD